MQNFFKAMSELRKRGAPASASASENSEVSSSNTTASTTAKKDDATTTTTTAAVDPAKAAEDSRRAMRFLALLSLAILIVPLVTWYLTQKLLGVGTRF